MNKESSGGSGAGATLNSWPGDAGDLPVVPGVGSDYFNTVTYYTNQNIGLPPFAWIDTTASSGVDWGESAANDIVPITWSAVGSQVVELFTGGKPTRLEKSLFILSQSLSKAQFSIFDEQGVFAPGDIAPGEISLGSYGNLDSDGTLTMLAAGGQHVAVTPKTSQTWYSGSLPGKGKYTLNHQTECTATGNTNNARTTIGIGEVVYLSGMPDNTVWSVSGGGYLSSYSGSTTTFVAYESPSNATVTAKYRSAPPLSVTFKVIPPSSIIVDGHTDALNEVGITNVNGTLMGALTYYQIEVGPNTVSFNNTQIREVLPLLSVTWPNGATTPIAQIGETNGVSIFCGTSQSDKVGAGLASINYLFNGTSYVDFSYPYTWQDQYQNEAGTWTTFKTMNRTTEYHGSNKQCRVTYLGVSGGWQGPYQ